MAVGDLSLFFLSSLAPGPVQGGQAAMWARLVSTDGAWHRTWPPRPRHGCGRLVAVSSPWPGTGTCPEWTMMHRVSAPRFPPTVPGTGRGGGGHAGKRRPAVDRRP